MWLVCMQPPVDPMDPSWPNCLCRNPAQPKTMKTQISGLRLEPMTTQICRPKLPCLHLLPAPSFTCLFLHKCCFFMAVVVVFVNHMWRLTLPVAACLETAPLNTGPSIFFKSAPALCAVRIDPWRLAREFRALPVGACAVNPQWLV